MDAWAGLQEAAHTHSADSLRSVVRDAMATAHALVSEGFIRHTPATQLPHVARYLNAQAQRITRAAQSPQALERDREAQMILRELAEERDQLRERLDARPYDGKAEVHYQQVSWMLEELRVSLYAQQLGTAIKVSPQRLRSALAKNV